MYRKKILCWLVGIIFFLPLAAQPKYEIRASWVTTLGGMDWPRQKANSPEGIKRQKEELCQLLEQLKEANFNTVLFQTRLRGDVIYPSAYEPFAESITGHTGKIPAYDPLAFAVEECHKRGMEIHAWFVSIPIGNDRQMRLHGKNAVAKSILPFANTSTLPGIWIRETPKPPITWQESYAKSSPITTSTEFISTTSVTRTRP